MRLEQEMLDEYYTTNWEWAKALEVDDYHKVLLMCDEKGILIAPVAKDKKLNKMYKNILNLKNYMEGKFSELHSKAGEYERITGETPEIIGI